MITSKLYIVISANEIREQTQIPRPSLGSKPVPSSKLHYV